jgi:hypothetical protein
LLEKEEWGYRAFGLRQLRGVESGCPPGKNWLEGEGLGRVEGGGNLEEVKEVAEERDGLDRVELGEVLLRFSM